MQAHFPWDSLVLWRAAKCFICTSLSIRQNIKKSTQNLLLRFNKIIRFSSFVKGIPKWNRDAFIWVHGGEEYNVPRCLDSCQYVSGFTHHYFWITRANANSENGKSYLTIVMKIVLVSKPPSEHLGERPEVHGTHFEKRWHKQFLE